MRMLQRYCQVAVRLHQLGRQAVQMREIHFQGHWNSRTYQKFTSINSWCLPYYSRCCTFVSNTPSQINPSDSDKEPGDLEKDDTSDFFGIEEYEKTRPKYTISDFENVDASNVPSKSIRSSRPIKAKNTMISRSRASKSKVEDNILQASFGYVRFDGQRPQDSVKTKKSSSGSDFIDDQYFQYEDSQIKTDSRQTFIHLKDELEESPGSVELANSNKSANLSDSTKPSANIFDEQYFGSETKESAVDVFNKNAENPLQFEGESESVKHQSKVKPPLSDDLNLFDQQMFGHIGENSVASGRTTPPSVDEDLRYGNKPAIYSVTEDMEKDLQNVDERKGREQMPKLKTAEEVEYEFHEPETRRRIRSKLKPIPNTEKPKTAFDMAMKIRAEVKNAGERKVGKVDSKGFRILKNQVPDFSRTPEVLMVKILKDSIIYNDNDIVAIDKPYGIASQDGPGVHHSIASLLPKLAKKIDPSLETLHSIHRLDKETTGVMIFAKTRVMQLRLIGMFRDHEVIKKYWVLTKGIPEPPSGVIEIPMAEATVNGAYRMALKPEYDEKTKLIMKKSKVDTFKAITKYQVLDSNNSAALLQCEPQTGVKHQIRCHLAFGLNNPILGDHKYSHFTKLAPQRLYPVMLQRLGIRQSKVRHVPLHLHAKSIIIPNILEGRYLHLSTRLPKHFVDNMKKLKLKPPQ